MQTIQVRIFALAAALCAAGPAISQTSNGQEAPVVKGEIESSEPILDGYTIQLYEPTSHSTLATSEIRSDGEFEFRHTPFGSYLVTVTNPHGDAVYQGDVIVGAVGQSFIIRLPKEEISRPVSGTVSVQQLQHPPTRKAFEATRAAQKLSEAGEFAKAAERLQKAVAISPGYADAWLNLGAQHLRLHAYQQAVDETRRAMELAGPSIIALGNLAYGLALLGHNAEALDAAEQGVRLKPDDAHANYILGVILYTCHGEDAEVLRHLKIAAPMIAGARMTLAKIEGQ